VREVGEGVTSVKPSATTSSRSTRRNAASAKAASPQDQPLHRDPRHAGQGPDAGRHQPLQLQGQTDLPLHGLLDLSNFTVLPEIALAKIRKDAPFDKVCYIGCGVTTGVGAVINTAKVEPGANVVVFGLGGIGLNVIQGARMVGADMIVGVDINPAKRNGAERSA
jgi:S-(hydroxymethyl)glutathione dehydrogenase/alcohol dehydrogenase